MSRIAAVDWLRLEGHPRKVRIVSNGEPSGAAVYDAESGAEIDDLTGVAFDIDPDGAKCALTITLDAPVIPAGFDVQTRTETLIICKAVKP